MESRIRRVIFLIAVALFSMPHLGVAQSYVINTYSLYSMYGLGELQTQGTLSTRSMGGAGVATRSRASINLLNPASYSIAIQKGILFDTSVEGSSYFNAQQSESGMINSNYTTVNFHDISLQIPITKGLGFGFSVSPFSSVGYRIENNNNVVGDIGYYTTLNEGYGDITLASFGVGWEMFKGFSVGIAGKYYWGNLDRAFSATLVPVTTGGTMGSFAALDDISISRLKAQIGLQWNVIMTPEQTLTVGATYDIGGDLRPKYARLMGSQSDDGLDVGEMGSIEDAYLMNDTVTRVMVLPRELALGVSYMTSKVHLAFDYSFQNWGDENDTIELSGQGMEVEYNNVHTIRLGAEYTPYRADARNYLNRVSYRVGGRLGGYQYSYSGEKLAQYAATAGFGFPINNLGISKIDLGFEWGRMGSLENITTWDGGSVNMVRQTHFKFSLGFTFFGSDYWFRRPEID